MLGTHRMRLWVSSREGVSQVLIVFVPKFPGPVFEKKNPSFDLVPPYYCTAPILPSPLTDFRNPKITVKKKIKAYIAHISHMIHGALHTYQNEIGRQLMKAPQAAAIGLLLISSHPPHP